MLQVIIKIAWTFLNIKKTLKFKKMFNSKQNQLFEISKKKTSGNLFLQESMKESAKDLSGNLAPKYSTTGNDFIDQFGKLGSYKEPRNFNDIFSDMSILYSQNPEKAIKFTLYIRMITRTVQFADGTKTSVVQRGAGLKHEAIVRMIWLCINHPHEFWSNIELFISIGSWKDIIQMLSYDLQYNGWNNKVLNWNEMGRVILSGLENPNTSELVKKYLPQIKAKSKCTTIEAQADNIIAKWICSLLYGEGGSHANYKKYRKLKTSGTAHQWQQLISQRRFLEIDFNTVHGRALSQLVSGKFLSNQGLEEKYEQWIASKPVAKFTGYPFELFGKYIYNQNVVGKKYQIDTINKQFNGLVETAKKNAKKDTSLIVVRDTSGSMRSPATGTKLSANTIAKSLALFFSYMLPDGEFANSWIEFSSIAKMHKWKGSTPVEKWNNDITATIGNTNFQGVINLFTNLKQSVSEENFPTGIICISDGEFDPADLEKSNVEIAYEKLRRAGFSHKYVNNFKIVLWNLRNSYYGSRSYEKFETYGGDVENVYYFSGYDPSVVAFLTGNEHQEKEPKSAEELFEAAMNQEVLSMVTC